MGRTGLIYGVLSDGRDWIFIKIDNDDKLYVSDSIIVGLGAPVRDALRQVLRTLYAILEEALRSEKAARDS